jgi:DNA mismatch repair protein MutL
MAAIRVLPPQVADAIAAGEVVERPASVVKELVENAVDAGAERITVDVEGAGLVLVRVLDDGHGMPAEEAPLAFVRHATSKIASVLDLERIHTMGFRGEALPSIAAVARVRLLTRAPGADEGTEVRVEGGSAPDVRPGPARPGTVVEVRELFYNVPARRRFLKSPAAEAASIGEAVSALALAHPQVHLRYFLDGREVLNAPPAADPLDRVLAVLGMSVADQMLPVAKARGARAVQGHVSRATLTRATTADQTFIVNGRPVRSKPLLSAVRAAYKGRTMVGRHPIVVLRLDLPPEEVDVNVHPAKAEVRFREEKAVLDLVEGALRDVLEREAAAPAGPLRTQAVFAAETAPAVRAEAAAPAFATHQAALTAIAEGLERHPPPESMGLIQAALEEARAKAPRATLPPLEPIGQIGNKYLLARTPGGMAVIDQHAAAERYSYELLGQAMARGAVDIQELIDPVMLTLHPREMELAKERQGDLAAVGFRVEPFGPRQVSVASVPAILHDHADAQMLHDILTEALQDTGPSSDEEMRDRLVAITACHYSIRAGEALDARGMAKVVENLYRCRNPFHCIHGRPTVVVTSLEDLDKMFKRTGPA